MGSKKALEHGLHVALWAVVGVLIARTLVPSPWWILGLLIGPAGGYLATDFRQLKSAAITAWQTAVAPGKEWWIPRLQEAFWAANVGTSAFPLFILLAFLITRENPDDFKIMLGVNSVCIPVLAVFGFSSPEGKERGWSGWKSNLIPVYGWYIPRYVILKLAPKVARGIAWCVVHTWKFIRTFLLLIHSQKRVLRAMDTAIGAGTAFLMGGGELGATVLIAATVGFLVGIVHWEVVSVRWLKIVPNGNPT